MKRLINNLILPVWIGLCVLVAVLTMISGFGGHIDQSKAPVIGILVMTFPAWYAASTLMLIVNLMWCRRLALTTALAMVITLKPLLVFAPPHFGADRSAENTARTFKVMSYNVMSFVDDREKSDAKTFNSTVHEIIHSGADVVAVVEYNGLGPMKRFVPKAQIDSLHSIYPYEMKGSHENHIYSKQPLEELPMRQSAKHKVAVSAFRTTAAGRPLTVIVPHLQSFDLSDSDKNIYRELANKKIITADDKALIKEVRRRLLKKLLGAFAIRAEEAQWIKQDLASMGGDVIICGDFNDVPGSSVICLLEQAGLKDAYAEVGHGPCATFNEPGFPFRIDHVLWRGNMRPLSIKRGNVPSSDHYPFTTTFEWLD